MDMKFKALINELKEKFYIKAEKTVSEAEFNDILLLDGTSGNFKNDTLYIGQMSQLMTDAPLHILYWGEECDHCSLLKNSNSACIEISDFPAIFNDVKQELIHSLRAENEYAGMLRMILDGKNLTSILDSAAQRTNNAFVALDISGKLLAHSNPFDVPDPLWIKSVSDGYCSYDFMNHIKKIREKGESPKTAEAFISVCESTGTTYLCSKILSGSTLLGYMFMFDNDSPIDSQSREILTAISRVACELIVRNQTSYDMRTNLYHGILSDMLAGIDPSHASVRIQVSELSFPTRMCVLMIRPSYYQGEHYITGHLQELLMDIFNNPPYILHKGSIVLIVPLNESQKIEPELIEKLSKLAESEHLQIGISNGFTQASRFAAYFSQAEDALHYAQKLNVEGSLYYYCDYAFFSLLNTLPSGLGIGKFCHPALGLLRKYDRENGTSLYQTLKVYTETGLNQRHTAEKLFLHRNTLNYRMNRIEEIAGIDFNDPSLLFPLMYSFKIDDFNQSE